MSKPQMPPSVQITRAGWFALALSLALGIGLRLALQYFDPERYVQTTRNDPRQGGLGAIMMIPVFALWVWIVFTLLGYPLVRVVPPPAPPTDETPKPGRDPDAV
jgi:hypothetical protein